jgi:hypothetical protein
MHGLRVINLSKKSTTVYYHKVAVERILPDLVPFQYVCVNFVTGNLFQINLLTSPVCKGPKDIKFWKETANDSYIIVLENVVSMMWPLFED